ncbi:hypothetical protein ABH920_003033 [Catenulispora sp. EB89]
MAYFASGTNYWGSYEPTLTAHWWASPTVASFSVDTAPVSNHGARTQICGSNSWADAGYLLLHRPRSLFTWASPTRTLDTAWSSATR